MEVSLPCIPFPAIAHHATIGDRRSAALVAADGTIDWLCWPRYDSQPLFGALLDTQLGGYWRLGPRIYTIGQQSYFDDSAIAVTRWSQPDGELELTDFMPWPADHRQPANESRHVVIRRLRCTRGETEAVLRLNPRPAFGTPGRAGTPEGHWLFFGADQYFGFWSTLPVTMRDDCIRADVHMRQGDEHWAVLAYDEFPAIWSIPAVNQAFEETLSYWHEWRRCLRVSGPRAEQMKRAALVIHLLTYAPTGALVAAPTNSLPERFGGPRNYDYRFAWVRDASLSILGAATIGDQRDATRYLDWLSGLTSRSTMPLQVVYRIDGDTELPESERNELEGYWSSTPVRVGNHAYNQIQPGSLGYLADCALEHLTAGGEWKEEYWRLLTRCADYIAANWRNEDNGIWELSQSQQFVSSKVLAWVVLDRVCAIGERVGHRDHIARWSHIKQEIHDQVMERGWNNERQSFVQYYGGIGLDASVLLIPIMRFLPPDHPKVRATVERITQELTIDGLVYRFQPEHTATVDKDHKILGDFEAAFLPCTFWLAAAYALDGNITQAEAVLDRAERLTNGCGLFAEEADPRTNLLFGNYPLLFSQVEHLRAILTIDRARGYHQVQDTLANQR